MLVVVFAFPFVAVCFSFAESLLSFEGRSLFNRLIVLLALSLVAVVVVVAPVAAVAFAFVAPSFALALAFLSFVVPICSYVHRRCSLVAVVA